MQSVSVTDLFTFTENKTLKTANVLAGMCVGLIVPVSMLNEALHETMPGVLVGIFVLALCGAIAGIFTCKNPSEDTTKDVMALHTSLTFGGLFWGLCLMILVIWFSPDVNFPIPD